MVEGIHFLAKEIFRRLMSIWRRKLEESRSRQEDLLGLGDYQQSPTPAPGQALARIHHR
jgi:hypothetical protein